MLQSTSEYEERNFDDSVLFQKKSLLYLPLPVINSTLIFIL